MITRIFFAALLLCAQVSASTILYSNGNPGLNIPGTIPTSGSAGPTVATSKGAVETFLYNSNGNPFQISGFDFTIASDTASPEATFDWAILRGVNGNAATWGMNSGFEIADAFGYHATVTELFTSVDNNAYHLNNVHVLLATPVLIDPGCGGVPCSVKFSLQVQNMSFNGLDLWARAVTGSRAGDWTSTGGAYQSTGIYSNGLIFNIQGTAGSAPPADTPEAITFLTVGSGLLCLGIRFRRKIAKGKGDPALALQIAASSHDRSPAGLGVVFSRV